jgi:MFS family permease
MMHNDTDCGPLARFESSISLQEPSDHELDESSTPDQITPEEVIKFTQTYNLNHKFDIFQKASLLIQGDTLLDEVPCITDQEIAAILAESRSKWRQPLAMYLTVVATALGAMGQGWSQTSMNGANLYFPKAFGLDVDTPRNNLILGLINSGIYLSNGLLGAWLVAPLNGRLGRRGAVFWATLLSLLANIGGALTQNWQQLLFFRLVLGCALGIISSTLNVFAAECVPAAIRGGLAVSWQMFCAFGIFVGFVTNVAVYDFGPNTWRLQLSGPSISTIPLLALIYVCPESPAWYLKYGDRYDLAYHSLARLRNTELQAAREVYLSYLQRSVKASAHTSYVQQITQLVTVPRIRRATLAAYTVMISQQLCGINIISFYSSTIFADANFSIYGALVASTVFGFVNFVGKSCQVTQRQRVQCLLATRISRCVTVADPQQVPFRRCGPWIPSVDDRCYS